MALPLTRILSTLVALLFLAAVGYKTASPGNDPYRCRAVKDTGQWLDPPDEHGNRDPFEQWQPDGCIMHKYTSEDIRRCFEGRRIVVAGDSTSRNVVYAIGRLLQRDEANWDRKHIARSVQFNLSYHGVNVERYPNVWLYSTDHPKQVPWVSSVEQYLEERRDETPIKDQKGPALVFIAGGVWYTHPRHDGRKGRMTEFHQAIANISELVGDDGRDMFTDPMDPFDGVGSQVFYAPPGGPIYLGQAPKKINDTSRRAEEVKEMQQWLHETENKWNFPLVWAVPQVVVGQDHVWADPLETGFHVLDPVTETRANILLNLRCNAKLDRMKSYPYNRTCCTDYGIKPLVQMGVVYFALVYLAVCIVCEIWDICAGRDEPQWGLLNMEVGSFALALLACYYADRTQILAKGRKVASFQDLYLLCAPGLVTALGTIRKTRTHPKYQALALEPDEPSDLPFDTNSDQAFLSREQTDEWKGWMQIAVLSYQWMSSPDTSAPPVARIIAAAYLFQTGYGHTTYFLDKKDFSFHRVASVLLRVNLLTLALTYIMDTDYMFYYFTPLVSFWFLVIYATMAIGREKYNGDVQLIVAKICISALVVSAIVVVSPLCRGLFSFLTPVFKMDWNFGRWQSHLSLDMFIVYIGMLTAVAKNEMERSLNFPLRVILAVTGFATIAGFLYNTSRMDSTMYSAIHPYVSFIPILGYVALRNVSGPVRNFQSRALRLLGRCSLESYLLQHHIFQAADGTGVLVLGERYGDGTLADRWMTLVIIAPVFLWICHNAARGTRQLIRVITPSAETGEKLEESSFDDNVKSFSWASRAQSIISPLQIKLICIIVVMVLFNVFSPSHILPPAPDGFTTHHVNVTKGVGNTTAT